MSTEDLNAPCKNTNRELWREREDDYYADSIHVTERGGIGINCGGIVYVQSLANWHKGVTDLRRLTDRRCENCQHWRETERKSTAIGSCGVNQFGRWLSHESCSRHTPKAAFTEKTTESTEKQREAISLHTLQFSHCCDCDECRVVNRQKLPPEFGSEKTEGK